MIYVVKKIMIILLSICFLSQTGCGKESISNCFFAWMDGYLAMHSEEEFSFALTLFYERGKKPFEEDEIITLSFGDLEQIEISHFDISLFQNDLKLPYAAMGFKLTVKPNEIGVFKTDKLVANINNSIITFPIGNWVFDIVDANLTDDSEELIDIWSSLAAGGNPRIFAYDYSLKNDEATIREIWLSENTCISDTNGVSLSNEIELPEIMNAPLNFIRPKIIIDVDNKEVFAFGMSYYCGAFNVPESTIEASRERNVELSE